jgi:hypothetical protein
VLIWERDRIQSALDSSLQHNLMKENVLAEQEMIVGIESKGQVFAYVKMHDVP